MLAVLPLVATGCIEHLKHAVPFPREPVPTVEDVIAPLHERTTPVATLWLRGSAKLRMKYVPGWMHFDATILATPPDRLRLRAFRNAVLVYEILADEWGLRVHNAIDKRFYAGSHAFVRRSNVPWTGLASALLRDGLLVESSLLDRLKSGGTATVHRHWKTWELRIEDADGEVRARFDRVTRRVVALRCKPATGGRATRLKYGEMLEVGGVRLPRWVELDHGPSRIHARFDVSEADRPKVNIPGGFDPRVFRLEPPPGQRWLPLDQLRLR